MTAGSARATGQLVQGLAIAISVGLNALVSPILGASQRPRRPAPAVPAVLHGPDHRPDVLHRAVAGRSSARPCSRRELRLPGGAHLLRRDAPDGQLPGDARQAVRDRRRASATGDDLRGADSDPARHHRVARSDLPDRRRPVRVFAIPIFLVVREPAGSTRDAGQPARHRLVARPAPGDDRARPRRARPLSVPPRPVLLQRRGQHGHRRDERRGGARRSA